MKILLLGDYSALHLYLRNGLRSLGHSALLLSSGDGSKAIHADIKLGGENETVLSPLRRRLDPLVVARNLGTFDISQAISSLYFAGPGYPKFAIYSGFAKLSERFFLSASGGDSFFLRNAAMRHRDLYLQEIELHGLSRQFRRNRSDKLYRFNQRIANLADGIIPISYEHSTAYISHPKLMNVIPMPIDVEGLIPHLSSTKSGPLRVLHGVTRAGHKGSRIVQEAFQEVSRKHPGRVECELVSGLSHSDFLQTVKQCDVLVDQLFAHTTGMTGLIGMALGKVVISGVSETGLRALGQETSPVVDTAPTVAGLVDSIESLLASRRAIPEMCLASRNFIEYHHDYRKVAGQYLEAWKDPPLAQSSGRQKESVE